MFLECAKKLVDTLKIKLPDITVTHRQPLYEWHANLFTFNRRKGVIIEGYFKGQACGIALFVYTNNAIPQS